MIVLGPVIGSVTKKEAIILFEMDISLLKNGGAVTIKYGFSPNQLNEMIVATKKDGVINEVFQLYRTSIPLPVFMVDKPTLYYEIVADNQSLYQNSFQVQSSKNRTSSSSKEKNSNNIAIFSCNHGLRYDVTDQFNDIIKSNAPLMLHLGDQIYQEEEFDAFMKNKEQLDANKVLLSYCNHYRQKWMRPAQRAAMASRSNRMLCDDHDYYNDILGNIYYNAENFWNEAAQVILRQIYIVYQRYQRNLKTDEEIENFLNVGHEGQLVSWNDSEFLMVDTFFPVATTLPNSDLFRKGFAFKTPLKMFDPKNSNILGDEQRRLFSETNQKWINQGKKLRIVSQRPLVNENLFAFKIAELKNDKSKYETITTISYQQNRSDLSFIIDELRLNNANVQDKSTPNLWIGGDAHYFRDILLKGILGEVLCQVLITSPISSAPYPLEEDATFENKALHFMSVIPMLFRRINKTKSILKFDWKKDMIRETYPTPLVQKRNWMLFSLFSDQKNRFEVNMHFYGNKRVPEFEAATTATKEEFLFNKI